MSVKDRIQKSKALSDWLNNQMAALGFDSDAVNLHRYRVAGSVLYVALMHHQGIITLLTHPNPTSAFALLRLYFDAYVRGVWLHRCASDDDLSAYVNDSHKKSFDALLKDIECVEAFSSGVLSSLKQQHWKAMNSYAHAGYQQVARHLTENEIAQNFSDDEIVEVLQTSDAFAFLVIQEMALMAGRVDIANKLLEGMKLI